MYIDMLEGVQDGLHELVVQGDQLVVVQLQPLQRVKVVKRARRDQVDAEGKNASTYTVYCLMTKIGLNQSQYST